MLLNLKQGAAGILRGVVLTVEPPSGTTAFVDWTNVTDVNLKNPGSGGTIPDPYHVQFNELPPVGHACRFWFTIDSDQSFRFEGAEGAFSFDRNVPELSSLIVSNQTEMPIQACVMLVVLSDTLAGFVGSEGLTFEADEA